MNVFGVAAPTTLATLGKFRSRETNLVGVSKEFDLFKFEITK